MARVVKSLNPGLLIDLQKGWENRLVAMKASNPVLASVSVAQAQQSPQDASTLFEIENRMICQWKMVLFVIIK